MTTIEKIEKGIITLAEFTEDQQSFIRGIVKLSFNEGQEQALRIHDVVGRSEQLPCDHDYQPDMPEPYIDTTKPYFNHKKHKQTCDKKRKARKKKKRR
jgi:hypothetical protein